MIGFNQRSAPAQQVKYVRQSRAASCVMVESKPWRFQLPVSNSALLAHLTSLRQLCYQHQVLSRFNLVHPLDLRDGNCEDCRGAFQPSLLILKLKTVRGTRESLIEVEQLCQRSLLLVSIMVS